MAEPRWVLCDWETKPEIKTMVLSFLDNNPSQHFTRQEPIAGTLEADDLVVHQFQESYTNHVIRVRLKRNPSIGFVIKMAPACIPLPGVHVPLPVERGERECLAYSFFNNIAPGCVPKPLFYDKSRRILCTRELTGCRSLTDELLTGGRNSCMSVSGVRSLGSSLASVHAATHILTLGTDGLAQLRHKFPTLHAMVDMIRLFHFEKPFDAADPDRHCASAVMTSLDDVINDAAVQAAKEEAKRSFAEDCECLIHGDLHVDSVVVSGGDLKMVDAEFVRVGPCAFDMGLLLATLLMIQSRQRHALMHKDASSSVPSTRTNQDTQTAHTADMVPPAAVEFGETASRDNHAVTDRTRRETRAADVLMEEYLTTMTEKLGQDNMFMQALLKKILTFCGVELLAWVIGPPHMDFMDSSPEAQADCLRIGTVLLKNVDKISSVDDFVNLVQQP
ncbi:hypothetical protein BaRGS_00017558 [Batillaria attramentaria]|uniref:Aminoglycoside phosphotransferase domain-containing protein n=1 Tax=Batillaria attramentaria TaxID=370345 RepID=A0ABD0KW00_9CAEN